MGCENVEPHLSAYVDNELSRDAHALVERHLADCPACRHIVEEIKLSHSVMQQWKPAEVSDGFLDKMRARLRHERRRASHSTTRTSADLRPPRRSRTVIVSPTKPARVGTTITKMAMAASVLIVAGLAFMLLKPLVTGAGQYRPVSVATFVNLADTAENVEELGQLAHAADVLVARHLRAQRPRPARVIATETVQLFLERAALPAQQKHLRLLLGADGSLLSARRSPARILSNEFALWFSPGGGCFAQELSRRTEAALIEGILLERMGKFGDAIRAYSNVKGSTHDVVVAHVRKAGLLMKLGRIKEAQEALTAAENIGRYSRLQKTVTEGVKHRIQLARRLRPKIDSLEGDLALEPRNPEAWRELADLHLQTGNYADAAFALDHLSAQAAPDERAMVRLRSACCRKNIGDHVGALARLTDIRQRERLDGDLRMLVLFQNADVLYRLGRYDESIDAHRVLIGYPDTLDDGSRALLILRVGYIQLYDLADPAAARSTLTRLSEPRYKHTPAARVAQTILTDDLI